MKDVKKAFDLLAQEYDKHREFIIPDFHQFYGSVVWAAESDKKQPRILDIGAGTGLLSAFLFLKFPGATFTLMDFSENMIEIARERFTGEVNIQYIVRDYSKSDLGGSFDLICSALSIHHLETQDKQDIFKKIFSSLVTGGLFVNADQAEGETSYFTDRYISYWNDFLKSGPFNEPEHLERLKLRSKLDKNEKLSDQLRWLSDAGFLNVDVIYKNRTFFVTVAGK